MKKILLALALIATIFTTTAQAHGYNRGAYFAGGVVIGAATYAYANRPYYGPRPIYGPPAYYGSYYAPVIIQQPQPVYIQQQYPSNEYHQETILDGNCNCYRTVLVRN